MIYLIKVTFPDLFCLIFCQSVYISWYTNTPEFNALPFCVPSQPIVMSVLSKNEMNLELITASLINDLVIVKDYSGLVYLPEWDFNSIGNVIPGQAYQIKMYNSRVLSY